jgi:hypothetical protein
MSFIEVNSELFDIYEKCETGEEMKQKADEYIQNELENIKKRKLASNDIVFSDEEVNKSEGSENEEKEDFSACFKNYDIDKFLSGEK